MISADCLWFFAAKSPHDSKGTLLRCPLAFGQRASYLRFFQVRPLSHQREDRVLVTSRTSQETMARIDANAGTGNQKQLFRCPLVDGSPTIQPEHITGFLRSNDLLAVKLTVHRRQALQHLGDSLSFGRVEGIERLRHPVAANAQE
ncbi:MAG: hypothetical protein KatS3mg111_2610 [Pirellulaceae bacterium]|nr:MAG: hypothetical protein KatS3mg111_2610 [Pirellulaceae bacterium]